MPLPRRFRRVAVSRRARSPLSQGLLGVVLLSASAGCGLEPSSPSEETPRSTSLAGALTGTLPLPATCADLRASFPSAPDGDYLLYVQGDASRAWLAWCQDMAGTPTEYLSLASLEGPANYSEYAAGGSSPGTSVRTTYRRLRVDPSTLALHTSDQRFASSTGQLTNGAGTRVTSMPFAAATSCSLQGVGTGSIDLRGTPFSLPGEQLSVVGGTAHSLLVDPLRQTFQLASGATCGVTASLGGVANAYNQRGGALKLKYLPPALPATCAQVRQRLPMVGDGLYTLYAGNDPGRPWVAWCQDMAGTPAEYLPLAATGPDVNFSQYTAGGWSPGSNVRTHFTRLRIDPTTFAVNTSDQRFSSSSGRLYHVGNGNRTVTSMPYASSMDCMANAGASGLGNIDLRGTPFFVQPNQFYAHGGSPFAGGSLYGARNQTVQLRGGGACGWNSLGDLYDPMNQNGGTLRLQYMAPVPPSATCAQLRQKLPTAGDGFYTLYVGGDVSKPWQAWCQDMAGTPLDYLPLASSGMGINYSQYVAGGRSPGSSVYTAFHRLRIDPTTLTVHTGDQRFTQNWGRIEHAGIRSIVVTSMPYASAMDCKADGGASGAASVDLRGTPFSLLPNQFSAHGGAPFAGTTTYGEQDQTVQLRGGGSCGWNSLHGAYDPMNQNGGSLRLRYVPPAAPPALPATCAQVRQLSPGAQDGLQTLFLEGDAARPWVAWCHDMAGTPTEYLPLPHPAANVSEFLVDDSSAGSSVRTVYSRVRIDPATLSLLTGDPRFATSTGQLSFAGEQVTSMPLGSSLGCDASGRSGQGSIDLRGTPFALVAGQFSLPGGAADGVLTGNEDQTLQLQGVPTCGWVASSASVQPMNQDGAPLSLRHITAFLPSTCAQVRQSFPSAGDGHYTLYVGGDAARPWKAWCQDMASAPAEYLSLAPLGASANFSEYLAGGLASGSTVRTVYTRLRLDPSSLQVNTADQRFTSSSGQLKSGGTTVTAMPYATAMNCNLSGATGQGSIDLRGTPFSLQVSQLAQGGSLARGSAVSGHLGQTAQLQGGGSCGWSSLRGLGNPVNQGGGPLQLTYGPSSN